MQRLRVHPGRDGLARVVGLSRQREQQRPLCRPRLPNCDRPSIDPAIEIALAAREQQRVELGEVHDTRNRDQMIPPAPANLALHTTLFVGPLKPRGRELRLKQRLVKRRQQRRRLNPKLLKLAEQDDERARRLC